MFVLTSILIQPNTPILQTIRITVFGQSSIARTHLRIAYAVEDEEEKSLQGIGGSKQVFKK